MYFVITYLFFYVALAVYRLDWAVMFLIASLPAYLIRFDVLGIPFTLLEAMILISFAIWFLYNYKKIFQNLKLKIYSIRPGRTKFIRYPFDVEIVLLLIISFAAAGVAGFGAGAMGIWKAYFFEPALVFILVFNIGLSPLTPLAKGGKILWPLAVSAFIVSVFAIYQKFTGAFIFNELWAAEETRRVTSFFGYPNAVGLYLGPIVMVMTGWLTSVILRAKPEESQVKNIKAANQRSFANAQDDKMLIIFVGIVIILSLLSIYFAKSEGALIGVAAGLVLFGLLAGKKIRWAAAVLILLALIGIIMSQPLRNYAVKKITLTDLSGEIRKQQWRETWEMLKDGRIITGAGLANYQNAVAPYHQEGIFFNRDNDPEFHRHVVWDEEYKKSHWQPTEIYLYPHNIILNFWSELGLAGLLLFVWVIIKYFWLGISNFQFPISKQIQNSKFKIQNFINNDFKYINIGLMCAMVVIIIHGFVDVPYFKNDLAAMFWLLIAMTGLISLKLESVNN